MMMHLGVPRWHYAFTRVVRANKSLDPFPVSDPHLTAYFTKTG